MTSFLPFSSPAPPPLSPPSTFTSFFGSRSGSSGPNVLRRHTTPTEPAPSPALINLPKLEALPPSPPPPRRQGDGARSLPLNLQVATHHGSARPTQLAPVLLSPKIPLIKTPTMASFFRRPRPPLFAPKAPASSPVLPDADSPHRPCPTTSKSQPSSPAQSSFLPFSLSSTVADAFDLDPNGVPRSHAKSDKPDPSYGFAEVVDLLTPPLVTPEAGRSFAPVLHGLDAVEGHGTFGRGKEGKGGNRDRPAVHRERSHASMPGIKEVIAGRRDGNGQATSARAKGKTREQVIEAEEKRQTGADRLRTREGSKVSRWGEDPRRDDIGGSTRRDVGTRPQREKEQGKGKFVQSSDPKRRETMKIPIMAPPPTQAKGASLSTSDASGAERAHAEAEAADGQDEIDMAEWEWEAFGPMSNEERSGLDSSLRPERLGFGVMGGWSRVGDEGNTAAVKPSSMPAPPSETLSGATSKVSDAQVSQASRDVTAHPAARDDPSPLIVSFTSPHPFCSSSKKPGVDSEAQTPAGIPSSPRSSIPGLTDWNDPDETLCPADARAVEALEQLSGQILSELYPYELQRFDLSGRSRRASESDFAGPMRQHSLNSGDIVSPSGDELGRVDADAGVDLNRRPSSIDRQASGHDTLAGEDCGQNRDRTSKGMASIRSWREARKRAKAISPTSKIVPSSQRGRREAAAYGPTPPPPAPPPDQQLPATPTRVASLTKRSRSFLRLGAHGAAPSDRTPPRSAHPSNTPSPLRSGGVEVDVVVIDRELPRLKGSPTIDLPSEPARSAEWGPAPRSSKGSKLSGSIVTDSEEGHGVTVPLVLSPQLRGPPRFGSGDMSPDEVLMPIQLRPLPPLPRTVTALSNLSSVQYPTPPPRARDLPSMSNTPPVRSNSILQPRLTRLRMKRPVTAPAPSISGRLQGLQREREQEARRIAGQIEQSLSADTTPHRPERKLSLQPRDDAPFALKLGRMRSHDSHVHVGMPGEMTAMGFLALEEPESYAQGGDFPLGPRLAEQQADEERGTDPELPNSQRISHPRNTTSRSPLSEAPAVGGTDRAQSPAALHIMPPAELSRLAASHSRSYSGESSLSPEHPPRGVRTTERESASIMAGKAPRSPLAIMMIPGTSSLDGEGGPGRRGMTALSPPPRRRGTGSGMTGGSSVTSPGSPSTRSTPRTQSPSRPLTTPDPTPRSGQSQLAASALHSVGAAHLAGPGANHGGGYDHSLVSPRAPPLILGGARGSPGRRNQRAEDGHEVGFAHEQRGCDDDFAHDQAPQAGLLSDSTSSLAIPHAESVAISATDTLLVARPHPSEHAIAAMETMQITESEPSAVCARMGRKGSEDSPGARSDLSTDDADAEGRGFDVERLRQGVSSVEQNGDQPGSGRIAARKDGDDVERHRDGDKNVTPSAVAKARGPLASGPVRFEGEARGLPEVENGTQDAQMAEGPASADIGAGNVPDLGCPPQRTDQAACDSTATTKSDSVPLRASSIVLAAPLPSPTRRHVRETASGYPSTPAPEPFGSAQTVHEDFNRNDSRSPTGPAIQPIAVTSPAQQRVPNRSTTSLVSSASMSRERGSSASASDEAQKEWDRRKIGEWLARPVRREARVSAGGRA